MGFLWPDFEARSGIGGILFLSPGLGPGVKSGSECFSLTLGLVSSQGHCIFPWPWPWGQVKVRVFFSFGPGRQVKIGVLSLALLPYIGYIGFVYIILLKG